LIPEETSVDIPKYFLLPSEKKHRVAPCEEKLSTMKSVTSTDDKTGHIWGGWKGNKIKTNHYEWMGGNLILLVPSLT